MSVQDDTLAAIRRRGLYAIAFRANRRGGRVWRMEAWNKQGHVWTAEHECPDTAAYMLAEFVGMDLGASYAPPVEGPCRPRARIGRECRDTEPHPARVAGGREP